MTHTDPPLRHVYPAVFKPLPGTGRWSVRFPDLAKESEVEGETLEEAILHASRLLRENVDALEHDRQIAPPPSPYENIRAGEGEIVQLLTTGSPEEAGDKGNRVLCGCLLIVAIFLLLVFGGAGSSLCGMSGATVTTTISDLRSLQVASLMYYADSGDVRLAENENHLALLLTYVGDSKRFTQPGGYVFREAGGVWWVGYDLRIKYEKNSDLRKKLAARAREYGGFFGSPNIDVTPVSADAAYLYKIDMDAVWTPAGLAEITLRRP
jgi:predicted RNase H-like HicB family nuclease